MPWPHMRLVPVDYCNGPDGEGKMADDYGIMGQSPLGHTLIATSCLESVLRQNPAFR